MSFENEVPAFIEAEIAAGESASSENPADESLASEVEATEEAEPSAVIAPKPKKTWLVIALAAGLVVILAAVGFTVYRMVSNGGFGGGPAAAKVNGEKITVAQLDAELEKIKAQNPTILDPANGGLPEGQIRKMLLDELIDRMLLEQEAEKVGVTVSDDEINEQIDAMKAGYPDEAAMESALQEAGYTIETLKVQRRHDLLVQGLLEKKITDDQITDAEVKAYYEEHKETFNPPADAQAGDSEAPEKSFEELAPQIKSMLVNQKRNEVYQDLRTQLRADAQIEILDPIILAYEKEQNADNQGSAQP